MALLSTTSLDKQHPVKPSRTLDKKTNATKRDAKNTVWSFLLNFVPQFGEIMAFIAISNHGAPMMNTDSLTRPISSDQELKQGLDSLSKEVQRWKTVISKRLKNFADISKPKKV